MENCRVTEFNGHFNNDGLYGIGECRLIVHSLNNDTGVLFFNTANSNTVKILASRQIKVNQGELLTEFTGVPSRIDIPYDETDCVIRVFEKYPLKNCSIYNSNLEVSVDLEHFQWDKATDVNITSAKGNLSDLSENMVGFSVKNCPELYGSIEDLKSSAITRLELLRCPEVVGDINNIKGNVLAKLGLGSNTPNVYGELSTLCDRMFAAGRTSGTLVFFPGNGKVTLNGTAIGTSAGKTITFSNSGWTHD